MAEATIEIEVKPAGEASAEAPAATESEIDTAAQAVATAAAASALATTQAAEAELDAASRVREIEQRMEEKWLAAMAELAALKLTVEGLLAQVSFLTSATATTEKVAEEAAIVATLAAETVMPLTGTSQTEGQENGEPGKSAEQDKPPRRGKSLFRI